MAIVIQICKIISKPLDKYFFYYYNFTNLVGDRLKIKNII